MREALTELLVRLHPVFTVMDQATTRGRIFCLEVDEAIELFDAVIWVRKRSGQGNGKE